MRHPGAGSAARFLQKVQKRASRIVLVLGG